MTLLALLLLAAPAVELPELPDGECFATQFVQTRSLPALMQPLVLHGQLRIERDGDLQWEITEPYHYRFTAHDGEFTEVTPDGTERVIDAAQAPWLAGVQHMFSALLAGNTGAIDDWFAITDVGARGNLQQLSLSPVSETVARVIESIRVIYGEHLRGVIISEPGGGGTEIRFEPLTACASGEAG